VKANALDIASDLRELQVKLALRDDVMHGQIERQLNKIKKSPDASHALPVAEMQSRWSTAGGLNTLASFQPINIQEIAPNRYYAALS
jgi:hypothetical protein